MVGMLAIAAAAWLLAFFICAMVTRIPPLTTGAAASWPELAGERPALVNRAVTRAQPTGAAYSATILDLAARGHLVITQRMAGQLWCEVPAAAPADAGLVQFERLVLAEARRLAGGAGAPFEAVAERCASDVRAIWDPFERALRAEGRQAGITRARLPVAMQVPLYVGTAVIGALVFATTDAMRHGRRVGAAGGGGLRLHHSPHHGGWPQPEGPADRAGVGPRSLGGAGGRGRRRGLAPRGPRARLLPGRAERAGTGGRRRCARPGARREPRAGQRGPPGTRAGPDGLR